MHRTYSKFIYASSKLHYSVFGSGENALFIFHGFGHTHKNMKEIEEALASDYRVYNFDLFFHGFSEWNRSDSPLTHKCWQELLGAFCVANNIDKFSVLGFSLGGKVALSTVQLFPGQVESVFLIAPDGVKPNFWYRTATSKLFKGLFRRVVLDPTLFVFLVKVLNGLRLIDKSTKRFASIQMNSREKRRRVYYTWMVFKGLLPDTELIAKMINDKAINIEFYVGSYDRIIPARFIKAFSEKIFAKKYVVLNSGHNNLLDEVAYQFSKELEKR